MSNREIFIDKLRQLSKEEMLKRYVALLNTERLTDYVADLEAKLAESEELHKLVEEQLKDMERSKISWENQYFTLYNTLKNYREVTNKKLEESFTEKDVEGLIKDREETIKSLREQLAKYKSYKTTDEQIKDLTNLYSQYKEENNQLKQQLAEKKEENQELLNSIKIKDLSNVNFRQVSEDIIRFSENGVLYEYNKKDDKIYKIVDQAHQDKISFVVEKLEKVSQEFSMRVGITDNNMDLLNEIIDNQIEQLKEGK